MYKNVLQSVSLKYAIYPKYVTAKDCHFSMHIVLNIIAYFLRCVFFILLDLFNKYVNCFLQNIILSVTTNLRGNCCKFLVHRSKLKLRKSFLTNRCISILNSLPDFLVESDVSATFTLGLKNTDITHFFNYIKLLVGILLFLVYSSMFACFFANKD